MGYVDAVAAAAAVVVVAGAMTSVRPLLCCFPGCLDFALDRAEEEYQLQTPNMHTKEQCHFFKPTWHAEWTSGTRAIGRLLESMRIADVVRHGGFGDLLERS
jgi:hypothetical protein